MIAIVDTDGTRLVVWGLGETEAAARSDAWHQDGYRRTAHERVREVNPDRVARIEAGDVEANDLA